MKKLVALCLAVVMVMGLLVACSGNGGHKAGEINFEVPEGGYDGSDVTLSFYHTMGSNLRNVLDDAIERFNALYPNIHIKHEQIGGYNDVKNDISTKLTAGDQPNIAYCYPDHVANYNITGKVITLDKLIESVETVTRADGTKEVLGLTDEQLADFYKVFWEEGKNYGDGLTYSVPMSRSIEVLYYNKTFFEKNNLKVPTTWDEMEETCKKIKEIDPKCIPLGYDSESNWFISYCEQTGSGYTSLTGEHYIFDNDANKTAVKRFREWYQKGYVTTETLSGAYTSSLFTELGEGETRCYMCVGSSGGSSYQIPKNEAFEVGIALPPQADAKDAKIISQGPSLCVFENKDPQKVVASWLFVKFLMTDVEFQASFSIASGYMPVIKSARENEAYAAWLNKADGYAQTTAQVVARSIEWADYCFTSPAFNGSAAARTQVEALMCSALSKAPSEFSDSYLNTLFSDAIDECKYFS